MKKKILLLLAMFIIIHATGITYSFYSSSDDAKIKNALASFIVNVEKTDNIDIPLDDIKPGDEIKYDFSVLNNSNDKRSDVTIVYNLTINTLHFIPLEISLYDDKDNLILTCDESYSRNSNNELECKSDNIDMAYYKDVKDNYYLKIVFPIEYSESKYSSLVDYINLKVDSYQKTE